MTGFFRRYSALQDIRFLSNDCTINCYENSKWSDRLKSLLDLFCPGLRWVVAVDRSKNLT